MFHVWRFQWIFLFESLPENSPLNHPFPLQFSLLYISSKIPIDILLGSLSENPFPFQFSLLYISPKISIDISLESLPKNSRIDFSTRIFLSLLYISLTKDVPCSKISTDISLVIPFFEIEIRKRPLSIIRIESLPENSSSSHPFPFEFSLSSLHNSLTEHIARSQSISRWPSRIRIIHYSNRLRISPWKFFFESSFPFEFSLSSLHNSLMEHVARSRSISRWPFRSSKAEFARWNIFLLYPLCPCFATSFLSSLGKVEERKEKRGGGLENWWEEKREIGLALSRPRERNHSSIVADVTDALPATVPSRDRAWG